MIAIALGDPTGIGPEVALKAVSLELSRGTESYLIIGDIALAHRINHELQLGLELQETVTATTGVMIHNPDEPLPQTLEPGNPAAARAALSWLRHGARLCLRGEASALVTAPVNKESIIRSGEMGFVGQTELLSKLAGTDRTAMMLLGADDRGRWLRVALATIHVPIRDVSSRLKRDKIEMAIELAARACGDLGLSRARVGVCGLNPHAGEGGQIGDEEIMTVAPAVLAAQERGFDVQGPFAADTLFHHALHGKYDAVVGMYHDQGLVPLKMIAFEHGVNWTLGLPFIRTSPDHGTAYDIAGQGIASPSSMLAAIRLAKQLARRSP